VAAVFDYDVARRHVGFPFFASLIAGDRR
jgi:hypothetical protein